MLRFGFFFAWVEGLVLGFGVQDNVLGFRGLKFGITG